MEIRAELGWSATDALDVFAVAEYWGIPVVPMSALPDGCGTHGFLQVFRTREQDSFSAITIFTGTARLIVHNDSHHPHRQSSNIAHELSHCILEHPSAPLRNGDSGCRDWNATYEAEADWLGGALLIPWGGRTPPCKRGTGYRGDCCAVSGKLPTSEVATQPDWYHAAGATPCASMAMISMPSTVKAPAIDHTLTPSAGKRPLS